MAEVVYPQTIELYRNPEGIWIGTRDWKGGETWYAIHATDAELARAFGKTIEEVEAAQTLPSCTLEWHEAHGIRITRAGGWIDTDWD